MRARSGEPSLRNDICYLDTTRTVPPVLFKADFFKPHPSENEDNTNLRSQFVTANYIKKQRFYPYAFLYTQGTVPMTAVIFTAPCF